jgi:GAF domain-containing protein
MIEISPGTELNISEYQYDRWRSKFLKIMLWIFCALGLVLLVSVFGNASSIARLIFALLYIALLAAAFLPFPYRVKTGTLLAVGYSVGMYSLLRWGPWADGVVYFLAVSILAVLLLDHRAYIFVPAVTIFTVVIVGVLNVLEVFPLLAPSVPETSLQDWVAYSVDYIVLSVALVWGITLFKREFKVIAERFNSNLQKLRNDREDLEQKVIERTEILTKKTNQLQAASYVARQTAEVQDLSLLLNTVAALVTDQFGFYHTGIFLINKTAEEVVLQAASSPGGRRMRERGHSLAVGKQGIVGLVAANRKPRIALDIGTDAVFFNNPDLPMTRSELALPLLIRNKVIGVMDIHSDQPQAFTMEDVDVLQTLADQVAVAIENARLLDESQAALSQLEALTAIRTREAWNQKLSGKSRAFTYTPLGLRAEKLPSTGENHVTIPLTLRGQTIGSISVARKGDSPINKSDEELIAEVASQAGLAIDNIRLLEDATQRAKQEQIVGKLAGRFSQSLDVDTLLQTAVRELAQLPDVSEVSIFVGKQDPEVPVRQRNRRNSGLV